MRRGLAILVGAIALAVLAACSGDSTPQQQAVSEAPAQVADAAGEDAGATAQDSASARASQPAADEKTLLAPRWPRDDWRPLVAVAMSHEQLQPVIERELRWCAEAVRLSETQGGERWGAPDPDGPWQQLPGPTLVDRDEQQWVGEVALATARQRGLPLADIPALMIVSTEWSQAGNCEYWSYRDRFPLAGFDSWWVWRQALGLLPSTWTQEMWDLLPVSPHGFGWYAPGTGTGTSGSIGLVASNSTRDAAQGLSEQLVHHLQQPLAANSARERIAWSTDTDRWLSFWWLRAADAAYSTLAIRHDALDGATDYAAATRSEPSFWDTAVHETLADEVQWWWLLARRDAALIERLLRNAGPDAVDERLQNPPDATEQLLHIEKYEADEQALDMSPLQPVIDAALPCELWVPMRDHTFGEDAYRDTQGEMTLRMLLRTSTGRNAESDAAAAGWGGDRLHLFERANGSERDVAALWAIAFDDAAEHAEGVAGLREWLIAYSNGLAWGAQGERVMGWDAPHGAIRVLNSGSVAWLFAAPDAESADAVAERLLAAAAPILWGAR